MSNKSKKWSDKEKHIVDSMMEENRMYREISIALKKKGFLRTADAVRGFVRRQSMKQGCNKGELFHLPLTKELDKTGYLAPSKASRVAYTQEYDDALVMIENKREQLFNIVTNKYEKIGNPEGPLQKVVSISDMHIPWVNDNVIADMVSKHSDAEVLVINGDFLDQFSVSKWPKSKGVLLRHEYEIGLDYLREFSKMFKTVVLTRGNHDDRLEAYFNSNLNPSVSFMVNPDMLKMMADGFAFDNSGKLVQKYDLSNVHYKGGLCGWYAKVGNCIFAHPKGGSKVPMKTSVGVADYFLEKENYDAIVIGHTHKIGQIIWKGKLIIEQGCCCVPMDYEADAKMQYSQQAFGYAVVYMNSKGQVNFDKSRPVYYGTATAVDTDVRISLGE